MLKPAAILYNFPEVLEVVAMGDYKVESNTFSFLTFCFVLGRAKKKFTYYVFSYQ